MGIMLVYDITNEKTFDDIVKWLRNIDEVGINQTGSDLNVHIKLNILLYCNHYHVSFIAC